MSKLIKFSLVLLVLGIALCGFAVFYFKRFAETGSQPVFATSYITGTVLTAFATAMLGHLLVLQRLPRGSAVFLDVVVFAAVVVGLFSPFYMLK